jgi:nucleotide-binding universal stress UspA family protein
MYSNILVPVNLEESSSWEKAVPTALALSRCFGANVGLVYVVPDATLASQAQWSGLALRRIVETARARLCHLAAELRAGDEMQSHVTTGRVFRGILDVAEQEKADLIVLASHRPDLRDLLIGENAERIVRHARCSVLVVRS